MRLLYITNGISGIGGLERVLSIKASYFAETLNYDVHIITLNDCFDSMFYHFSDKIHFHNVEAKGGAFSFLKAYVQAINKVVKSVQPDVISVCDDGLKGLYVPLWIKKGKAALVYERHASMRLNGSKIQTFLMQLGGFLYDKVVVLTRYNLSEWKRQNVTVIPNPLSIYPDKVSSLTNKKAICVGSISHNKGYDLLIEAWEKVALNYPDWEVNIYGKGDATIYQKMIDDKGLTKQIRFCGPTSDVQSKYLDSSLFILPSRSEGFGMVLIEAMACGLPCVSFDCPCGPRDIIEDGVNGYLATPENSKDLANKIFRILKNKENMQHMASHSRTVLVKYGIETIAKSWDSLFSTLQKD